jgi:hypothetical protein
MLVATHAPTKSRIEIEAWYETELVNRQKCEERARWKELVPREELGTVDEQVIVGPEAYDTRVWVAVAPGAGPGAPVNAHLFSFSAFLRRCIFVHFATEVPSDRDEKVLSARLATARTKIVGALTLDPPRVLDQPRPPGAPGTPGATQTPVARDEQKP